MKQPKKLTFIQKQYLAKKGLDPKEWALVKEEPDGTLHVINKVTGEEKHL